MTWATVTWRQVEQTTAEPIFYGIAVLAVVALFGREMWVAYRSTRSVALTVATTVLTVAAFAIVTARLLALLRLS